MWADTDEEDNADSIDEDAQVETDEDQVRIFKSIFRSNKVNQVLLPCELNQFICEANEKNSGLFI